MMISDLMDGVANEHRRVTTDYEVEDIEAMNKDYMVTQLWIYDTH